MVVKEILSFVPKVGDGISWVVQKGIQTLAQVGVSITPLQTKIMLIIVCGILIYGFFSFITIAKKVLKWALVILIIFLLISILASIFV